MNTSDQPSIRFRCPHCSAVLRGRSKDAGRPLRCPKCKEVFRVPKANDEADKKEERKAKQKKKEALIPVVCGVCATRIYANTSQVGSLLECPDCFTQNLVKPPKKVAPKAAPLMDASMNYDIEPEQQIEVTSDLGRNLLEEADRKVVEEIEAAPTFPKMPFVTGVYTYPFFLQVFPLIISMSLSWAVAVALTRFALVLPFMIPVAAIVVVLVILPTLVTFQKMFEHTSIADDESDCRPPGGIFGIIEWAFDAFPIAFALFLSSLPAVMPIVSMKLNSDYLVLIPVSIYILFPLIYMSMLESASVAGIVSMVVLQSLVRLPSAWFKFYAFGGFVFALIAALVGGFVRWRMGLQFPPAASHSIGTLLLTCAGVATLLTIYFRLFGRVALVLSHKLEVEDANHASSEISDTASTPESEVSLGV